MKRAAVWALSGCVAVLAVAGEPATGAPELTAAQIVEKNVAARGGLKAWRKIQTMVWTGHIERSHVSAPSPSFVLQQKRPNKTRFEIRAAGQTAVRLFDGSQGWKLHPARDGGVELQPFTAEELSFARDGQGIDGPLMDHDAKGIAVALEGVDEVEGHKAYRLNVTLPSGASHHVWIDAQSFLDLKYDQKARQASGRPNTVSVYYRNYRTVEGLQIPFTIESGTDRNEARDRLVIDRISLNSPLDDRVFTRPNVPRQRERGALARKYPRPNPELAGPGEGR